MVLKYVTKNGVRYHEPPYAKEQEAEFYRCVRRGPITVARPASDHQTTNKQQTTSKTDPLSTAPQRWSWGGACLRLEPVIGVNLRLVDRDARF